MVRDGDAMTEDDDQQAPPPRSAWRLVKRILAGTALLGAFGLGTVLAVFFILARDLPDLHSLADYHPAQTTRVFDADGNLVARLYKERRTVLPIERIPAHVKNAFLAAEDASFYSHEGLDYGALFASVLNEAKVKVFGGSRRGGSTITQQTAKTFLLSSEKTYTRKLKEMILAKRIEDEFTKDEILFLYLNQIYFGHGAYGIEEAARTYYGKGADKLTLGQAAALASVPKWPNRINPKGDLARLDQRRTYVLEQMVNHQFATAEERAAALKEPLYTDVERPPYLDVAPYYTEHIRQVLTDELGSEMLLTGGLTVYASLKAPLQDAAQRATQMGLREVDKRQGYRGPLIRLDPDQARGLRESLEAVRQKRFNEKTTPELADADRLKDRPVWDLSDLDKAALQSDPPNALSAVRTVRLEEDMMLAGVVKKVDGASNKAVIDLGTVDGTLNHAGMKWARPYSPTKWTKAYRNVTDVFKVGDVVLVRTDKLVTGKKDKQGRTLAPWVELSLEQIPEVQGAFVAINPHTHRVVAMVGGYAYDRSKFNRALQAKRQPGSSFKPFIYATGIETKQFTPVGFYDDGGSRLITDAPKVYFDRWTGKKWNPKNSGGRYRGDITLRTCLTFSVNTCSISILEKVGVEEVHKLAEKVGLLTDDTPFPKNLTLALGTGEVYPLSLVNAYGVFPARGRWSPPVFIEKVKDNDGKVLYEHKDVPPVQVISEGTAFIMSQLMKSVIENGTATRAKVLGKNVAGKTGTTNMARSVWFVGFSPELVAGAYVGFDNNDAMGHREYGGKAALPIWLRFMSAALSGRGEDDFETPAGVVKKALDSRTGLLASASQLGQADPAPGLPAADLPPDESTGSDDPDVLPPSEEGELPEGVYEEFFLEGTAPVRTAEDAAPPPLELLEMGGGLGP